MKKNLVGDQRTRSHRNQILLEEVAGRYWKRETGDIATGKMEIAEPAAIV